MMNPFGLSDLHLRHIADRVEFKKTLVGTKRKELFNVFDFSLGLEERVALEFLYAFMPLVDLADYGGELFLKHVRHSLKAIEKVSWGEKITGSLFLHYVLPYRISNEKVEDYRPYFWRELFDRVKTLPMKEIILEVNHWCHEKATYIASDPRTASPLSVVRTARGRCGEESALLVAALRSLAIPARQVYTPRWAHTDSNHAWVEAWADGRWFFLGACEPEPRLNMGWFDGPARRSMLLHTRVLGTIYDGPEEKVQVRDDYTELNLTTSYAAEKNLIVQVRDKQGTKVAGAEVDLQVFNYGAFSSLARLKANDEGLIKITTGRGDVLIHAVKDGRWGSTLARSTVGDMVEVVIGEEPPNFDCFTVHVPPGLPQEGMQVTAEERARNDRRLKEEDELRAAYEATFITQQQSEKLASELGLDSEQVWNVLEKARGNSHIIAEFLEKAVPQYGAMALQQLTVLSEKDLTDTSSVILLDHLEWAFPYRDLYPEQEFINYILQPRISHEVLTVYRDFFQQEFNLNLQSEFFQNPFELKAWIDQNIVSVTDEIVRGWPTPKGTYKLRAGNKLAKDTLFVAMSRSFGIPARLSPIDSRCQFMDGGSWVYVESDDKKNEQTGVLHILKPTEYGGEVKYFQHFSLARLEDGFFQTLQFRGLDEQAFDEESFSYKLELSQGDYRLTTGNRLANGNVLVTLTSFSIIPNEVQTVRLNLAKEAQQSESLGQISLDIYLKKYRNEEEITLGTLKGAEAAVLVWLEPDREPTKHLIKDLKDRRVQFDDANLTVLLCLGKDKLTESFVPANYGGLPTKTYFIEDADYKVFRHVQEGLSKPLAWDFPIVVAIDDQGIIRYVSTGYQIGTGSHILRSLQKG